VDKSLNPRLGWRFCLLAVGLLVSLFCLTVNVRYLKPTDNTNVCISTNPSILQSVVPDSITNRCFCMFRFPAQSDLVSVGTITQTISDFISTRFAWVVVVSILVLLNIFSLVLFVVNNARHKRSERSLAESENKHKMMIEAINDGVFDVNLLTNQVEFSPMWYTMLGFKPYELPQLLKTWEALIHSDDRKSVLSAFRQAIDSGNIFFSEYRMRKKNGGYIWVLARGKVVHTDLQGKPLRFLGTHKDITKRKSVEELLKKKHTGFCEAQKMAHLGNWDWDIKTGDLFWTDEVFRIFGIKPNSFDANIDAFLKFVHPQDRDSIWALIQKCLQDPDCEYDIRHRIIRPDGTERIVNEKAIVSFDQNLKPIRMIGTVQDVTEQVKAHQIIQKSRDDLKQLTRKLITAQEKERKRLAREMHDDLSQRLAVISIDLAKLERPVFGASDTLIQKLTAIRKNIVKLAEDVHDISRQLHPSIIDDLGLVDAINVMLNGYRKREELIVDYTYNNIPEWIPGDISICVYRILQEGLRNITKHADINRAEVMLVYSDNHLKLTVQDYGTGFDLANVQGKLGLGLASMKERAELIGGLLTVNSVIDHGTTLNLDVFVPKQNVKKNNHIQQFSN